MHFDLFSLRVFAIIQFKYCKCFQQSLDLYSVSINIIIARPWIAIHKTMVLKSMHTRQLVANAILHHLHSDTVSQEKILPINNNKKIKTKSYRYIITQCIPDQSIPILLNSLYNEILQLVMIPLLAAGGFITLPSAYPWSLHSVSYIMYAGLPDM